MFQERDDVIATIDGKKVPAMYECNGPLAGDCSVLVGEPGKRVRHIVKIDTLKAAPKKEDK